MKILIATPLYPPDIGGPATYSKLLEEELPKRGIDIELAKYSDVRHLPKGLSHLAYLIKVFQAAYGKDLLYVMDPSPAMLPAVLAAFVRGRPYALKIVGDIAWEQGQQRYGVKESLDEFVKRPDSNYLTPVVLLRMIERFVARHASAIIVPSAYLRKIIAAWGIPQEKITVVYNAFDGTPLFVDKDGARTRIGITGTILLSAGRLVPWKGFSALIALTPELKKKYPGLKFIIVGSGPIENELRAEIISLNLTDTVIMTGNIPHNKLMEYIRAADCFVLNTGYEGLSHQLLEVLAVGTPIVTTAVGGNPEIITDGETGLLVPCDDRFAIRTAIERFLDDRGLAARIVEAGKRFVAGFTVDRAVSGALMTLHDILHSK